MRKFLKNAFFLGVLSSTLLACNPQQTAASLTGNTQFEANFKGNGTAFYAIDGQSGQLSFMLDSGENAGKWTKYGTALRKSGTSALHFKAIERSAGASFYIVDGKNGQLSFMLDYGENAGAWTNFGQTLPNATITEFEANSNVNGMIFYAYDGVKKQMYFMQDFGGQSGEWIAYGEDKN